MAVNDSLFDVYNAYVDVCETDDYTGGGGSRMAKTESKGGAKFYPNPTTGMLTVEIKDEVNKARLELYDAVGNIVYNQPVTGNTTTFSLPALANGIYHVRLWNNNSIIKHDKLVIIR